MNRTRKELDRLRAAAWRNLGDELRRTSARLGQAGVAFAKRHPILVLGGTLLAGFALWRRGRAAPVVKSAGRMSGLAGKLLRLGAIQAAHAVSCAIKQSLARERVEQEEPAPSNGHTRG